MVKDEETYPEGTIVSLKKTYEFARIVARAWLRPELKRHFLHYEVEIEGRGDGHWAVYHDEIYWEAPPNGNAQTE